MISRGIYSLWLWHFRLCASFVSRLKPFIHAQFIQQNVFTQTFCVYFIRLEIVQSVLTVQYAKAYLKRIPHSFLNRRFWTFSLWRVWATLLKICLSPIRITQGSFNIRLHSNTNDEIRNDNKTCLHFNYVKLAR